MSTDPRVAEAMELVDDHASEFATDTIECERGGMSTTDLDKTRSKVESYIESMAAEIARLTAELEEARIDAARWTQRADKRWHAAHDVSMRDAALDVLAERSRQISAEGWTPEHDDEHGDGELARAASVYANPHIWDILGESQVGWPWDASWWRPSTPRQNLVKAGALILAEIERLDRAAAMTKEKP
jgi:hypothetical protein